MTPLLLPGFTCASVHGAPASGLLIDGRDYYKAVYDAFVVAKRSILMAGWQFENSVALLRGTDADGCDHDVHLIVLLRELCEARPELEVYILAWDSSPVFAFERIPLQKLLFKLRGHERIHFKMDNMHPTGASHHQKLIVVDRAIAFVGGMDVCESRWDDRTHAAKSPLRHNRWFSYRPFHDVQAYVTGDAVDVLRGWFCERWQRATAEPLELPFVAPYSIPITPTLEVDAPQVGLARTLPRIEDPPTKAVHELYHLHLRAIEQAERLIYIENQYLSSDEIGNALIRRMERVTAPLEIAIVLPEESNGLKEWISIGIYQHRILERLTESAARTGHRLGVYYTCAKGKKAGKGCSVFIHAKVLAIDDRFLLVSSANTSNRSMGFDTELGLAWEAPAPTASVRAARIELLREHCGLSVVEAEPMLAPIEGLIGRLDELARNEQHRLRIHRRNADEKPGFLLSKWIPDETPFDPDNPRSFQEALPEPGAWLDRFVRDPIEVIVRGVRRRRYGR